MKFIEQTLLKDEKIVFATRPHWIIFFYPLILLVAGIWYHFNRMLLVGVNFNFPVININLISAVAIVIWVAFFYQLVQTLIMFFYAEYGVTNRRVIMKEGWIYRRSLEIFWDKIEAVHVDQGVIGRILNYGVITVVGTGGSHDAFAYIPDPLHFRELVQQEIEDQQNARHPETKS